MRPIEMVTSSLVEKAPDADVRDMITLLADRVEIEVGTLTGASHGESATRLAQRSGSGDSRLRDPSQHRQLRIPRLRGGATSPLPRAARMAGASACFAARPSAGQLASGSAQNFFVTAGETRPEQ